jgi:hypothetical protein
MSDIRTLIETIARIQEQAEITDDNRYRLTANLGDFRKELLQSYKWLKDSAEAFKKAVSSNPREAESLKVGFQKNARELRNILKPWNRVPGIIKNNPNYEWREANEAGMPLLHTDVVNKAVDSGNVEEILRIIARTEETIVELTRAILAGMGDGNRAKNIVSFITNK